MKFELKILDSRIGTEWPLPKYESDGAAAIDLRACVHSRTTIMPNAAQIIPAGIAIYIRNPGYAGILLPRGGLGTKGLVVGNLVGLFDSDYQGPIHICTWNRSTSIIAIEPGDRIAQLTFVPVIRPDFSVVSEFSSTSKRGEGAFGSTGKK